MSIDNAIKKRLDLLGTVGKQFMSIKYPKEFELYILAFELIDAKGKTLRYFVFPVMPSFLEESYPETVNIRRTLLGVTALSTTTFTPIPISLNGNFGRKFRVLLGTDYVEFANAFTTSNGKVTASSIANGVADVFDQRVKTGYGSLQVLKELLEEASVIDVIGPRRLIYYNPAFGTSYVVKVMDKKINMSQDTNMLHNYSISLQAIAPLESLKNRNQLEADSQRLIATNYAQKKTNQLVNQLSNILS